MQRFFSIFRAMKKTLSLFLVALHICFWGCKSDAPVAPEVTPKSSYQPVTKGSYWKYHITETPNHPVINATITMTGETEMVGGLLCHKFNFATEDGSIPGYFYHGNDIYLRILNSPPNAFDLIPYLKDNVAIGQTWEVALEAPNNISVGRIVEKDITRTVNHKLFTNVIHTQLLTQYKNDKGVVTTFQTTDTYIAEGVGLIESNSLDSEGPQFTLLQEYSIK